MNANKAGAPKSPALLDAVALLTDDRAQRVSRAQVGTVAEEFDENLADFRID
jgi:hypothetical protein